MYILCLLYKIHISAKIEYNPDCKVCFVRREYSVVALFMRGRGLRGYAEYGVDTCASQPHFRQLNV